MTRRDVAQSPRRLMLSRRLGGSALSVAVLLVATTACRPNDRSRVDQLLQRQEQMELQLQQLEQRLNRLPASGATGRADKERAPAGVVRSLTYRSGTSDDRLRIYWADGSVSDLPCTKEQNTLACG